MRAMKVQEIIRPHSGDMPVTPSVAPADKIIHAVELMLKHGCKSLTVMKNNSPVGTVRLDDALEMLGIRVSRRSREP